MRVLRNVPLLGFAVITGVVPFVPILSSDLTNRVFASVGAVASILGIAAWYDATYGQAKRAQDADRAEIDDLREQLRQTKSALLEAELGARLKELYAAEAQRKENPYTPPTAATNPAIGAAILITVLAWLHLFGIQVPWPF